MHEERKVLVLAGKISRSKFIKAHTRKNPHSEGDELKSKKKKKIKSPGPGVSERREISLNEEVLIRL